MKRDKKNMATQLSIDKQLNRGEENNKATVDLDIDLYKEFKGMLVRDVNKQTGYLNNPYIKKVLEHSKFANDRTKLKFPTHKKAKRFIDPSSVDKKIEKKSSLNSL